MNVNLGAPYEAILKRIIERGYAGNQTEAIRQALTEYERKLREEEEMMLVQKAAQAEVRKMEGKKWKSMKEVMRKAGF
jgi:Arc/MetJ-type ribon-helix-helix transcriptional regulator